MKPKDIAVNPRLAGLVKRYHTWPVLTIQSVAEHSWQVYRIYYELFGGVPALVAHYIMTHDMGELVTGDPPYPVKADHPQLKKVYDLKEAIAINEMDHCLVRLPQKEVPRVKLCHMLEMMEFGLHEMTLGNRYATPIFRRCQAAAQDIIAEMPDVGARKRALKYVRDAEDRLS